MKVKPVAHEEFFDFVETFNRLSGTGDEFSLPRLFKGIGKIWEINAYNIERLNAEFGHLMIPVFHEWDTGFQKKNTLNQILLSEHIKSSLNKPMESGYLLGAINDQEIGLPDPTWELTSHEEFFAARKNRSHIISTLVKNTQLQKIEGASTTIFLGGHSITPMHRHQPVFLLQILGKKKINLISPCFSEYVYCENISRYAENLINFNDIDLIKFPLIKQITIFDAVCEQGDILFIPNQWFHYVEALEFPSLSLSRFSKPTIEMKT